MMKDTAETPASARPTVLLWSGGKDAALSLDALRADPRFEVQALVTTFGESTDAVTAHGTPRTLIEVQAEAVGVPLHPMLLSEGAPNAIYEARLEEVLAPLRAEGVAVVAAGDLHLGGVRAYREALIQRLGFEAAFPLWRRDTERLARRFLDEGYRAVVASVDTEQLDAHFAGRAYDEYFLRDLPGSVDPCGENGEFHTFVTDGPPFARPVSVEVGPIEGEGRMRRVRLMREDGGRRTADRS